jgi:hypothetical protein
MQTWFFSFLSSRTCFGISVLVLESGFKPPPCGRGSLLLGISYEESGVKFKSGVMMRRKGQKNVKPDVPTIDRLRVTGHLRTNSTLLNPSGIFSTVKPSFLQRLSIFGLLVNTNPKNRSSPFSWAIPMSRSLSLNPSPFA